MNQLGKFIKKAKENDIKIYKLETMNINLDSNHFITDGEKIEFLTDETNVKNGTYCIVYDYFPMTIFITDNIKVKELYKILKKKFKIRL